MPINKYNEYRRKRARAIGAEPPLGKLLDNIEYLLGGFEKRVAALSLVVIMIAIIAGVAVRFFGLPLPSYGEIAIVAMSPLTFIGAALCSYLHQHITIDVVDLIKSKILVKFVRISASLAMASFAGYFTWLSWGFFSYARMSGERLIDMGTPLWIPMICIVIGSGLMLIHAVIDIVRLSFGIKRTGGAQ